MFLALVMPDIIGTVHLVPMWAADIIPPQGITVDMHVHLMPVPHIPHLTVPAPAYPIVTHHVQKLVPEMRQVLVPAIQHVRITPVITPVAHNIMAVLVQRQQASVH